MLGSDMVQFAKSLEMVGQLYRVVITKDIARMYFDALQDYDAEDVHAALRRSTHQSKWFPKPSELRESIDAERERDHRRYIRDDNAKRLAEIAKGKEKDPAPE